MERSFKRSTGCILAIVLLFYLKVSESFPIQNRLALRSTNTAFDEISERSTTGEDVPMEQLYVRENYTDTNKYLVIDDMIISKEASRAGLLNAAWPKGVVPIAYALTIVPQQRLMISQALAEISTRTCVQFRPTKNGDKFWLLFQNDPLNQGCSSYIGCQNIKNQPVQLSHACSKGNAIHEVIHALGFFHEQTRNDRDKYVKINYQNLNRGMELNFQKEKDMDPPQETTTYDIAYNYDSIMHYGKTFFSKNGQPTIEVLYNQAASGNGDNIGQRDYITDGDVAMINKKYNCPTMDNPGEEPTDTPPKPPSQLNPMCQWLPTCKQTEINENQL